MPWPSMWENHGCHRQWTRDRVLQQLAVAASEIEGALPTSSTYYSRLRSGKLHWPGAHRTLEYFGTMATAWRATGASSDRVTELSRHWSQGEIDYLLDNAGSLRLTTIAKQLNRTYQAVRVMMGSKGFGLRARWNQGFLSAANVADEYDVSVNRVMSMCQRGLIKGARRHPFRMQWSIPPESLTPEVLAELREWHRQMTCRRGHRYTPESTYWWRGNRYCRICRTRQVEGLRQRQARAQRLDVVLELLGAGIDTAYCCRCGGSFSFAQVHRCTGGGDMTQTAEREKV